MHFNRRFNINRVLVISIVEYLGSVSDADSTDNIASNPSSSTASREDGLATEPGYVEILGGEEPPDEWLNLGSRRAFQLIEVHRIFKIWTDLLVETVMNL